jgi:chromosome segregation ATPase
LGLSSTAKVPEVSPEGAAEVDLITEFEKQYTRKEKAKTMLQVGNPQLGREDKEYEGMQKEYEEMRETMKALQNRMNAKRATRKSIRHSIKVAEEEMAQAEARMQDVTSKMTGAQGIAIGKKLGVLERRSRKRQHLRSLDADPVPYEGQPQKVVRIGKPRQREIANEDEESTQH